MRTIVACYPQKADPIWRKGHAPMADCPSVVFDLLRRTFVCPVVRERERDDRANRDSQERA